MKKCPSCKYERTAQDNLHFPEYECPSCGVIDKYKAKFEFAELEKKREKERKAKLAKIKKEVNLMLDKLTSSVYFILFMLRFYFLHFSRDTGK